MWPILYPESENYEPTTQSRFPPDTIYLLLYDRKEILRQHFRLEKDNTSPERVIKRDDPSSDAVSFLGVQEAEPLRFNEAWMLRGLEAGGPCGTPDFTLHLNTER
jgi:hypothetical protein